MATGKKGRPGPTIPKGGATRTKRRYGCGGKIYKSGGKIKGKCKC